MVYRLTVDRIIEGYNLPFFVTTSALLATNEALTLAAPAGPGKIEGVFLSIADPHATNPGDSNIKLTVDGVALYYSVTYGFFMVHSPNPYNSPIAAKIADAARTNFTGAFHIDYEVSASIAWYNTYCINPVFLRMNFMGRVGW